MPLYERLEKLKVMESEHESGKDANNFRNKDDALSPIISVKDSDHDSESDAHKDISASHSASSSSLESSSDFSQIDAKMPQKSSTFSVVSPEAQEDIHLSKKKEKNDTPGGMSSKSEDLVEKSPFDLSSQVSHATDESTLQTASPVQSPPIQVMEKTGTYDPDRIPASVFGGSAMDWSVASNESLFSIHLGNNSFSREQFLMMNGDMYSEDFYKSGEFNKSGELNKLDEALKSGRPPLSPAPLSPVGKLQKVENMDLDKKPEQTEAADETMKDSSKLDVSAQIEEKEPELEGNGNSSMINRPSDASVASNQSFAFPILVDTTKSASGKGPSPRQQDMKPVVYMESPKTKAHAENSSSYWGCCCCYNCCSLPHWSCPSYQHCWSWKWCCCCCG